MTNLADLFEMDYRDQSVRETACICEDLADMFKLLAESLNLFGLPNKDECAVFQSRMLQIAALTKDFQEAASRSLEVGDEE